MSISEVKLYVFKKGKKTNPASISLNVDEAFGEQGYMGKDIFKEIDFSKKGELQKVTKIPLFLDSSKYDFYIRLI